jgi:hypothetical protein
MISKILTTHVDTIKVRYDYMKDVDISSFKELKCHNLLFPLVNVIDNKVLGTLLTTDIPIIHVGRFLLIV